MSVMVDGSDTIYGQEGEDKILGGGGGDFLYGDATGGTDSSLKRDIIIGDGGKIHHAGDAFSFSAVTSVTNQTESSGGGDTIEGNLGDDVILGGPGGDPNVQGGDGQDIILGDNGVVSLSGGVVQIVQGFGDGGVDILKGNAGNDILMGGCQGDTLEGNQGNDILIGDAGIVNGIQVIAVVGGGDGVDKIYGHEGEDKILGGGGGDFLYGDKNAGTDSSQKRDILIGDGGAINYSGDKFSFRVCCLTATRIDTSTEVAGGADTIEGNSGNDIILGGLGGDPFKAHLGNDVILGDDGTVVLSAGVVQSIVGGTTGSADTAEGNEGNDILLGGGAGDSDQGQYRQRRSRRRRRDRSCCKGVWFQDQHSGQTEGGADTIEGNENSDIILGGIGGDRIYGQDANDILIGDNGTVVPRMRKRRRGPPTAAIPSTARRVKTRFSAAGPQTCFLAIIAKPAARRLRLGGT